MSLRSIGKILLARCKHDKLNGFENAVLAQLALQAFDKLNTIALPFL